MTQQWDGPPDRESEREKQKKEGKKSRRNNSEKKSHKNKGYSQIGWEIKWTKRLQLGGWLEPGGQGVLWPNPFINKQADWFKINMKGSCQCGADGRITPPSTGTGQQALNTGCRLRLFARFLSALKFEAFCKVMYTRNLHKAASSDIYPIEDWHAVQGISGYWEPNRRLWISFWKL